MKTGNIHMGKILNGILLFTITLTGWCANAMDCKRVEELIARFYENTKPILADQIPSGLKIAPLVQRQYLINGEIREWKGSMDRITSVVHVEKDGKIERMYVGEAPLMDAATALEAVQAADRAYNNGLGAWPMMSLEQRIEYWNEFNKVLTRKVADMMPKREVMVRFLMHEIGKTRGDAEKEFDRTLDYIKETLKAADAMAANFKKIYEIDGEDVVKRRIPFGVTLVMGPFNYPFNETFTNLMPAVLMGNTVVFKPAKLGVLLLEPLLEAFQVFPKGVVNTIYGEGTTVITAIMKSGLVKVLAFIGSSNVASRIEALQPVGKPLIAVQGMGAKNPGIVLSGDNIDEAVAANKKAACSNNGQRCTAHKKIIVEESIAPLFIPKFADAIDELLIGHPHMKGVEQTALAEANAIERMQGFVDDAVSKGARIINKLGGKTQNGFFFPAVLYPVTPDMKIYHEEQFGPVIPIISVKNSAEAAQIQAKSPYAQQTALFSKDLEKLAQALDQMQNQQCRTVINGTCQRGPDSLPFTGIRESAVGTLSIEEALNAFSAPSLITETRKKDGSPTTLRLLMESGLSKILSGDKK
jgi:glyceraldehyde-3-phosphate dehydrogenase (NADP+)